MRMRVSMRARRSGRKEKKNERMTEGGGVCACALTQKEKQPLKEKKKNMNEKKKSLCKRTNKWSSFEIRKEAVQNSLQELTKKKKEKEFWQMFLQLIFKLYYLCYCQLCHRHHRHYCYH